MSNELSIRREVDPPFQMVQQKPMGIEFCGIYIETFAELDTLCKRIAESDIVPVAYKGKPGMVMVAIQMGREVGLPAMAALQNIAVINGRPSLWGDAILAVCKAQPDYEYCNEEEGAEDGGTWHCRIKRRGEPEVYRKFSMKDAQKAGLAGKAGPWTQYPMRMCQMRARGFATRDCYPDALRGMYSREEAMDMPREVGELEAAPPGATATERLTNKLKGTPPVVVEENKALQATESAVTPPATVNHPPDTNSEGTATRGKALWARWLAIPALPKQNSELNTFLATILGEKAATARIFRIGTKEQLDDIEAYLNGEEAAANALAGEADPFKDEAELTLTAEDAAATVAAMSQ